MSLTAPVASPARARAPQSTPALPCDPGPGQPAFESLIQRHLPLGRLEQAQGGAVRPEAPCAELQALLEEMRPVRLVSLDAAEEAGGELEERSFHDLIAGDGAASACELVERKELVGLLAERLGQLPEMQKKVLAMYYYENLRLADIAAAFGLTESRICQIHTQAVKQLRAYLQSVMA
jgi:RNA polymerase sigma factor for flagellar operon FliA